MAIQYKFITFALENVVLDYYLIDGFLQIRRNKGKTKAYKGRKQKQ